MIECVRVPEFVVVPAGAFRMGCETGLPDEQPVRHVTLASFLAGKYPVTNEQYDAFVRDAGLVESCFRSEPRFADPCQPAVGVSWHDATSYCAWLSRTTGLQVRLPAEAEREYAAAGGLTGDWPWPGPAHPAQREIDAMTAPHVARAACANGYGLFCMAENVHEWCSDWYAKDAYALEATGGPVSGTRKVARGGSWRHRDKTTRITARASLPPDFRYSDFGFRVYADLP
ncbi:hypothetical protein AYO38_09550 [bacterium SCGC AG-212-C10]|nr:hypothetical protein AYO38_09550 [bacterium SCGC AG-212-C10]